MTRKIVIASIVLTLILAVGGGVYIISTHAPRIKGQKPEIKESKEPLVKLVYVGTNETLSEALYHLDLQDGKLDEPHVVHIVLGEYKQKILFIGKDNKGKKEIIVQAQEADIDITNDGRIVRVYVLDTPGMGGIESIAFYNICGDLIFKGDPNYDYEILPDGKTFMRFKRIYWSWIDDKIEVVGLTDRVINTYKIRHPQDTQVHLGRNNWEYGANLFSSDNRQYHFFYLSFYKANMLKKTYNDRVILLDQKGNSVFEKEMGMPNAVDNILRCLVSNAGNWVIAEVFLNKPGANEPKRTTIIFGRKGTIIEKEEYSYPAISPDGTKLAFTEYVSGAQRVIVLNAKDINQRKYIEGENRILSDNYRYAFEKEFHNDVLAIVYKPREDKAGYSYAKDVYLVGINNQKAIKVLSESVSWDLEIKFVDKYMIVYDAPERARESDHIYIFNMK